MCTFDPSPPPPPPPPVVLFSPTPLLLTSSRVSVAQKRTVSFLSSTYDIDGAMSRWHRCGAYVVSVVAIHHSTTSGLNVSREP